MMSIIGARQRHALGRSHLGEFPSGQREQTVNLPAKPSEVRILPPPQKTVVSCWLLVVSKTEKLGGLEAPKKGAIPSGGKIPPESNIRKGGIGGKP